MKAKCFLGIAVLILSIMTMPNYKKETTQKEETTQETELQTMQNPEPVLTVFEIKGNNDIYDETKTETAESEPIKVTEEADTIIETETETETEVETSTEETTKVETESETVDLSKEELSKDELKKIQKLLSKKKSKKLSSSKKEYMSEGVKYTEEIYSDDSSSAYVCRMEIIEEDPSTSEITEPEVISTSEAETPEIEEGEKEELLIDPVSETYDSEQEYISE